MFFDEYHISRRIRSIMRQEKYKVTFDRDFEGVIKACAAPRSGRWHLTWITPRIMRAYAELYDAGYVHSFEVWNKDGELVGGGYGVVLGGVFVIEFAILPRVEQLEDRLLGAELASRQMGLPHERQQAADAGARCKWASASIPRGEYLRDLSVALGRKGRTGPLGSRSRPQGRRRLAPRQG